MLTSLSPTFEKYKKLSDTEKSAFDEEYLNNFKSFFNDFYSKIDETSKSQFIEDLKDISGNDNATSIENLNTSIKNGNDIIALATLISENQDYFSVDEEKNFNEGIFVKEFLDKLKNRCDSLGIDINIVGNSDLLLIYNGTTFYMEYYIYNNKLEVPLSIVSMNIKGKEYRYETYSFVDVDYTDSYDTVDNAVEEITDIVVNSNNRRKALKVINSFESFIEDMKQEDLDILLSYIKNNYDL